jgi:hypothetical protein
MKGKFIQRKSILSAVQINQVNPGISKSNELHFLAQINQPFVIWLKRF